MATTHIFRVTTADSAAQLSEYLENTGADQTVFLRRLRKFFGALANGNATKGSVVITSSLDNVADASAYVTLTCASVIATDTVVLNGVTFTAVNSGATGNQFNKGSSNTECATNIAAAINASTTALVQNYVVATSAADVVTVTAKHPGLAGNMFTCTTGGGTITVGHASSNRFTGGAGGNVALQSMTVS